MPSAFKLLIAAIAVLALPDSAYAWRMTIAVNGGFDPADNKCWQTPSMVKLATTVPTDELRFFNADGENERADHVRCDEKGELLRNENGEYILGNTLRGRDIPSEFEPANWNRIERAIQAATVQATVKKAQNPELILYLRDHGGSYANDEKAPPFDQFHSSLWAGESDDEDTGGDELSVEKLRKRLSEIPPGLKMIGVFDHCYSGGMLHAFFDAMGHPIRKNSCGFASSAEEQTSYPFQYSESIAEAINRKTVKTFAEAHHRASMKFPNPVPTRTSDVFFNQYFRHHIRTWDEKTGTASYDQECLAKFDKPLELPKSTDIRRIALFEELKKAEEEMKQGLAFTKLPEANLDIRRIDSRWAELTDELEELSKVDEDLNNVHVRVADQYLEERLKSDLEYQDLKQKVAALSYDERENSPLKNELNKRLLRASFVYSPFDGSNKPFAAYVKANAKTADTPWPVDLLETMRQVHKREHALQDREVGYQRARNYIRKQFALKHLIAQGSDVEIEEALDLLKCENSSIQTTGGEK